MKQKPLGTKKANRAQNKPLFHEVRKNGGGTDKAFKKLNFFYEMNMTRELEFMHVNFRRLSQERVYKIRAIPHNLVLNAVSN